MLQTLTKNVRDWFLPPDTSVRAGKPAVTGIVATYKGHPGKNQLYGERYHGR